MFDTDELAEGIVTTWAGTTRVTASQIGVRSVWLPEWTDTTRPGHPTEAAIEIERGGGAARAHLTQALHELAEFFAGGRRAFTVALDLEGGATFQRRAWAAVTEVPYGETRSYSEIARTIGAPLAVRAVGAANGANPVAPFVPCHRIVGSNGRLTGYGPGLPLKQRLLVMEDAIPASAEDYLAWVERVSSRLGTGEWVLGVRPAGTYCRPDSLHSLRHRLLPNRIFATPDAAEAEGWRPCPACFSDALALASQRFSAEPMARMRA